LPDETILNYTVHPTTVDYSVSDTQESIVTLRVTATNHTGTPVDCSDITISVPVGSEWGQLTEDPSTITTAPGPTTPWAIGGGAGTWVTVPLPPAISVDPGASVTFEFGSIIVNKAPGLVSLGIAERADRVRTGCVSVTKSGPAPAGSTPVIGSFTASPDQVAQDGASTLAWQVSDAQQLVLTPGPVNLPDPRKGTLPVNPHGTTVYTITALGAGGQAQAAATVTVMPAAIESFTAQPATAPLPPHTPVTLRWTTKFVASSAIDQGIGPVATSGSCVVAPTQTTVYTLTALGVEPQSRSITVLVANPE